MFRINHLPKLKNVTVKILQRFPLDKAKFLGLQRLQVSYPVRFYSKDKDDLDKKRLPHINLEDYPPKPKLEEECPQTKPQLPPGRVCEKASWWNRDHDKEKTDGAQIFATDNRPPEELHIPDSLKASDVADLTTEDFNVVRTKLTFVDKSEGIKRLFELPASGVQITAPRGFGKSTFINMLEVFLMIIVDKDGRPISNPESSDNYKMFMELKLGQKHGRFVKQHCGQYPVISLSLKCVEGKTKTDVLDSLRDAFSETFKKHLYLLETAPDGSKSFKNKKILGIQTFLKYCDRNRLEELSEADVVDALKFLSKILYDHFNKKVVILVDEADPPIMKAITDKVVNETLKFLMRLLGGMLSAALKDNDFLERSLVSSCVLFSGKYSWEINNQFHAQFLQTKHISEIYGFTEEEVHNLLENAALQAVNDFDGVKKWYNGYQTLNEDGATIYSSWSVLNYLSKSFEQGNKMFDTYWPNSGLLDILEKLLVHHEIYKRINELINGENSIIVAAEADVDNILELKNTISFPFTKLNEKQVDFFLQLLWDEGVLNAVEKYGDTVVLKIPNFEIKTEIQRKCYTQSLFETKYKLKPENIERYIEALNRLLLTNSNEQANKNEVKGEIEESEEGATEKCEEAIRNLVNAVSLLFSGDAVIPFNESELHHILFFLTYNNELFTTQSSRAVVKVSEELRDTDELKKFYPREAKTGSQKGRKNECDICVTRGTGGLILELKFLKEDKAKENSRAALEQIIEKNYYKIFDKDEYKYVRTKIYVGLCLKKNLDVAAHYLVDNIDINKAKIVCGNK